jgi:hypothetical protein
MLKKLYCFMTHPFIPLPSVETSFSLEMLLLLDLEAEIIDYAKAMPEAGKAEDLDFEVWGKGFCERMVSSSPNLFGISFAKQGWGRPNMTRWPTALVKNVGPSSKMSWTRFSTSSR